MSELRILVMNGVNLDLLGQREKEVYGDFTLQDLEKLLNVEAQRLKNYFSLKKLDLQFFQSNDESHFLQKLDESGVDGYLINPAAWTHTSVALADRLAALKRSFVEVHISNISARESFRKNSYTAPLASGVVYGFGLDSYAAGLFALIRKLAKTS